MDAASSRSTEPEEEFESLPDDEKHADGRFSAKVMKAANGSSSAIGVVEDIQIAKVSRQRIYLVRYADGDEERFADVAALDARIADLTTLEKGRLTSKRVIDVGLTQDERTPKKAKPDDTAKRECPICMDSVVDTVLDPCGHVVCEKCSGIFKKKPCPICRKKVKRGLRFYMP